MIRNLPDPRYYSCVGNMVWLPTPLKGFTDAVPEVKRVLRVCAFHLFGWACEHPDVKQEAKAVRSGKVPEYYPSTWPTADRQCLPPGVAPFSTKVRKSVARRKAKIRQMLADPTLINFPREEVKSVLDFWNVRLD